MKLKASYQGKNWVLRWKLGAELKSQMEGVVGEEGDGEREGKG